MTQLSTQGAMAATARQFMERRSKVRARLLRGASRGVIYALLTACSAVYLFPFLFMLSTSLKGMDQIFRWPPEMIPNPVTLFRFLTTSRHAAK